MNVKICGLRRTRDAQLALELGASHLGVVLAMDSPRAATLQQAREIVRVAAGRAPVLLVFRRQSDDEIRRACELVGTRHVQVHGADAERCRSLRGGGLAPVPVLRVAAGATALPRFELPPEEGMPALLDGGRGGQGLPFDWRLLGRCGPHGVFVAGGVHPDNVRDLLRRRPWGIDASSGIESRPGCKDEALLRALFDAVHEHEERAA